MKLIEKEKAIFLRKDGKSLREISSELGVATSTASRWVKDVVLDDAQMNNLSARQKHGHNTGRKTSQIHMERREEYQEFGKTLFERHGHEFMNGCMLYWAEGAKRRTTLRFTNSDQYMIKYFVSFLKDFFEVKDEDIKYSFVMYLDGETTIDQAEDYWSDCLGVDKIRFNKVSVNKIQRKSFGNRSARTRYGVCNISVYSVKIIQAIYGAIQFYLGFTNEEWLNAKC